MTDNSFADVKIHNEIEFCIVQDADVKKMIDKVRAQNAQYGNERGKFISIHVDKIDEYDDYTLEKVTRAANIYENFNAENSEANISAAQVEYINLKQIFH